MNLRDELRKFTDNAITDNSKIVDAYNHAVKYMRACAKNRGHSCVLSHTGRLSSEQTKALKQRLHSEGIEVIEHPGYDNPYT